MSGGSGIQARWCTGSASAAIAVLELRGDPHDLSRALSAPLPRIGSAALRALPGDDEGVVLRTSRDTVLVTPHGGPRVRQRISEALHAAGAHFAMSGAMDWSAATADPVAQRILHLLPRATSADALTLLLAQPARWRDHGPPAAIDAARSRRLRRLLEPPTVAIVGPPNAGKSSLLNALAGRELAAASPEAGTTRDYVSAPVDLAGLACVLLDAPGIRETSDPLEARAQQGARGSIERADLRISVAAPGQSFVDEWPDALRVRTKIDLAPARDATGVSARTGEGLEALAQAVREALVPHADLESGRPFDFDGSTGP